MKKFKKCISHLIIIFSLLGLEISCSRAPQYSPGGLGFYYIDSENGDDENKGTTPEKAWKTLERVDSTVFAPGDNILFKAGTYYSGRIKPQGSGTQNQPIVIDMYGDGAKPCVAAQGQFLEALLLYNVEYWEISNLEITNTGKEREPDRAGVRIVAENFGTAHHIYLRNLYVHNVNGSNVKKEGGGAGILWDNRGEEVKSRFDDLLIENCHLLRTDRDGIKGRSAYWSREKWFPSLNVVIRGNLLEDIGGDGIVPLGCDGVLVEYNVLRGAHERANDYAAGIWPWSCDNATFQFNEVSGVKGTKDGQGFDSDYNCRNTLFQYNYSHDNEGGFMLICSDGGAKKEVNVGCIGTVIRYNISQNDNHRSFHIGGPVKDTKIYNNVIYIGRELDVHIFLNSNWSGWANGTSVYNNIFYVEGTGRYSYGISRNEDGTYNTESGFGGSSNNIFDYNVFYGNHIDKPQDEHAQSNDPMLINPGSGKTGRNTLDGYKLLEGSPCIDSGMEVPDNGGKDFWGNFVPYNDITDRGAYEYSRDTI